LAPKAFWNGPQAEPVRRSASVLGIELVPMEQHPTDPVVSFTRIAQQKVDAVFVAPSSTSFAQREQLGLLALKARLPSSFGYSRMVETGGLMSYSTNIVEELRKISTYVDRILKGAKAGDLPMEQPTKFELVINQKVAKALGLTIPPSILLRTDRIIE
jgi:putative ABC transport system substrate-binding protein